MDNFLYLVLKHLHSIMRWILLVSLLITLVYSLIGISRRARLSGSGIYTARLTLAFAHLQLLVGLVLYLISPKVIFEAASMQSPILRFFLVEHFLGMVIAVALITAGYFSMKKRTITPSSSRIVFWFYLAALFVMLLIIPWPFLQYGASWI